MNNKVLISIAVLFCLSLLSFGQAEDPEKVFKLSKDERKLDTYMKERDWKKRDGGVDEDGDAYLLFRKKSFGNGYVYIAVFPQKFIHYQKFNSEKHDYSLIMTYDDFVHTPEGKTHDNMSMENENSLVKNITLLDHDDNKNQNKFYGVVPKHEDYVRE